MLRGREVRLRTLILLVVVPALILATAVWSVYLYVTLYERILSGFDRMLAGYSATTGAFIEGEDHAVISRRRDMAAFHYDASRQRLVGLDADTGALLRFNDQGGASVIGVPELSLMSGLSALPGSNAYATVAGRRPRLLYAVNPSNGTARAIGEVDRRASLLAADPATNLLWILEGDILTGVRPSDAEPVEEKTYEGPELTGLAPAPGGGLAGLARDGRLVRIHPLEERVEPLADAPDWSAREVGPPCSALARDAGAGRWWMDTQRLTQVRPAGGSLEVVEIGIEGYYNEDSDFYRTYAAPMSDVREKSGLTYLYTQILDPSTPHCYYIIDVTPGEEHTPIGYKDALPEADYRGARRVLEEGAVYIGEVVETAVWGLIKVSYAPIFHRDGHVEAMAGADVNISVIREKTRLALFTTTLIGVAALLLAGLVSLLIARRLTRPLSLLKDGALRMAAGETDHRIAIRRPVELKRLGDAFNSIARTLGDTLSDLREATDSLEREKRLQHFAGALDRQAEPPADDSFGCAVADETAGEKTASGWVDAGGYEAVWFCDPEPDALTAVRRRASLARTVRGLLGVYGEDVEDLYRELERLRPDAMRVCWFRRSGGRDIHVASREPVRAGLFENGRFQQLLEAEPGEGMVLSPGQSLLLTDEPALLDAAAWTETPAASGARDLARIAAGQAETRGPNRQAVLAVFRYGAESGPSETQGGIA